MQSPIYVFVWVAAGCSAWFLWNGAIKKLLLDSYRENLFELRFAIFEMGMRGELDFNSDVYRQIEVLFCGLLRFSHRTTLFSYIASAIRQEEAKKQHDYVDISQEIALKIERLSPATQEQIRDILIRLHRIILGYMAFTSLLGLAVYASMKVLRILGFRNADNRKISRVVEQEAYHAEFKHDDISLSASIA